jgi:hypothetical protein
MAQTPEPPTQAEMARHEQWAEAAYDRMYDAPRHEVKDCKDDACEHLWKAMAIAEALGLADERARLEARRNHIIAVYASQFRSSLI